MDRNAALLAGLDKATMVGVEVGPFYAPLVPKADGWKTVVVDYSDGDTLRAVARNHGAEAIRERACHIEDVDLVWEGQPLDVACLALNPSGYDYFIASHVLEHVPDLVRFLQQASGLLKSHGIISLAVPDMRKTFDLLKSPTSMNHVLSAYREERTRHTPETLFEARAYSVHRAAAYSWVDGNVDGLGYSTPLLDAWKLYQLDAGAPVDASYVDAHAWCFTPASFALLILELNAVGLVEFAIDSLALSPGAEFIVQMKRRPFTLSVQALNARRMDLALRSRREYAEELFGHAARSSVEYLPL